MGKIFSTNSSVKLQIILTYLNMSKIFLNLYLLKKICIHNRYQHVIKSAFSIFKSSIIYVNLSEQKPNYSNEKNQYRQTSSKPDKFNPYKPSVLSTEYGTWPNSVDPDQTSDQLLHCSLILFDLILYVPSTIFQLCWDGSSWVEPVLS